jgi:putative phosphoesterase
MRVAALYDIHGNLPALEAVLADVRQVGIDHIVVGGDVVPGPMPRETLACLRDLDIPAQFIHGNGDREVLASIRGIETAGVPEQFRHLISWNAQQLDREDEQWLASWPDTLTLAVEGVGEVLFCHATPRNDTEIFTRVTPADRLQPVFQEVAASVVVCGHTHMQFDRTVGELRVVNAGSVGMPFQDPGAYWVLLGPDIQLRHTQYNMARAAERIRATRYPQAEEFAARNILKPPSERETIEAFSKFELK